MGTYSSLPQVTQLEAGDTVGDMAAPLPHLVLTASLLGWR